MDQVQTETQEIFLILPIEAKGERLDRVLAQLLDPQFSRAQIQQWIRDARVRVDRAVVNQRYRVRGGEAAEVRVPPRPAGPWQAEDIALEVVYDHPQFAVINKPAGLVVHPGAGNPAGTLLNALLGKWPALLTLPRAGIVHRLDKDTSGLLVIAKDEATRLALIQQIKAREVSRGYRALVYGHVIAGGSVDAPIGRHARERTRMAVVATGKPSVTHYRVRRHFPGVTELALQLESGRTHQIRVHMTHIGHPLVGDPLYKCRRVLDRSAGRASEAVQRFGRQALHAESLEFDGPGGQRMKFKAPLPADMQRLIASLVAGEPDRGVD